MSRRLPPRYATRSRGIRSDAALDHRVMFFRTPPKPILTPCIGGCTLAADGFCVGCHRTGDEIAAWSSLGDIERARIMSEELPARETQRTDAP